MNYISHLFRITIPVLLLTCSAFLNGNAQIQLEKDLVLYLPMKSDLKDHSPNAYPIEIVGDVHIESEGAYFGGRKDWLEAPFIEFNQRPFSVSLWIKETSNENMIGLVEQFDLNRPLHYFHLMLREERQPYLGFYIGGLVSPLGISRDQEWFHITFQYTGTEQQIWINGRLIISRESPPYEGTTGVTAIGKTPRWGNVHSKDFVGYMRDFRIYHRILTHEEIEVLAGETIPENGETPAFASSRIPTLNEASLQQRAAMSQLLPKNPSLPFLQINSSQLIINGQAGRIYILEVSDDLKEWEELMRFETDSEQMVFEDPNREFTSSQFFRIRIE